MTDKLQVRGNVIRDIPETKLNAFIADKFNFWLSSLLSLTGETSAERLKIVDDAIKKHCAGMTLKEVMQMFEMYADNQMPFEPIPNYLDRILFGKILSYWKSRKPIKTANMPGETYTNSEKDRIMLDAIDRAKKDIKETGKINGTGHHIYDFMLSTGRMEEPDPEFKKACFAQAKLIQRKEIELEMMTDMPLRRRARINPDSIYGVNDRTIKLAKTMIITEILKK